MPAVLSARSRSSCRLGFRLPSSTHLTPLAHQLRHRHALLGRQLLQRRQILFGQLHLCPDHIGLHAGMLVYLPTLYHRGWGLRLSGSAGGGLLARGCPCADLLQGRCRLDSIEHQTTPMSAGTPRSPGMPSCVARLWLRPSLVLIT